ncbi:MAG: cell wall hydrolase, partial [Lachnospiraceae bacterium]|nr:cell wall hydrolase [Lachnospiraceae bacterium]
MFKKAMLSILFLVMWLGLTGFTGLGSESEDMWMNVLSDLTEDEIDEALASTEWAGRVMANVEESVNVREEASEDTKAIGKLYKGDAGDILEQADGWTKIQSGNVTGWVRDEYLACGSDAAERAAEDVSKIATVTAETLKVRAEANTDSRVIDLIGCGEQIEVGEESGGWLEIVYSDGEINYISAEYVEVSYEYGEAKTMEEIEAEEAARKAAEEKAKRTMNLGAIAASTDEVTLLAALIQAEGGGQPYEGKVGIGAVVMNRVRSGGYPSTIQAVIAQPGQFGPVATGKVAQIMASGPSASCMQAAQAAINGETTGGTATHFERAGCE